MSKKPVPKRKRPKSVMQKAWATRRKNALHRAKPEQVMNNLLYGDDKVKMPPPNKATGGKGKSTRRSKIDFTAPHWRPADHSMPQTDPMGIKVEEILAAAGSNNRSKARPEVRHRLYEMVNAAEFKGVSDGMAAATAKQEEALLCSLVAQFGLVDRPAFIAEYGPHIVSPVTLRVVVRLLESMGYTARGKIDPSRMGAEKASHINAIR